MKMRALISGITGQDGSYLAEFLLRKGYEVHGLIRRASTFNTSRLDHLYQDPHGKDVRLILHYGDLSSGEQLTNLIYNLAPEEVYHLGAQSHVQVSFEMPEYTGNVTGLGTARLLEAIRRSGIRTRFYQASSSEMFGNAPAPQDEHAPFRPRSPLGAAKVFALWMARNYCEGYELFTSKGIMFNHESPRRGETFVTRKITRAIAHILCGKQKKLYLGNLDGRRDWGYALEYVEAMWKILQHDRADDFVIGTGESHTVRELVVEAFDYVGLDWEEFVEIDQKDKRPTEVDFLMANLSQAREKLDWQPRTNFHEPVRIMVDADMEAAGLTPIGAGYKILQSEFSECHHWEPAVSQLLNSKRGQAYV